ncbi:MAG: O-antigen ligase family protein [Alphaproteobacteria bacterium]|nr:O-antigen ligase family protein [Alphaproteobacteria bacterium]
MEQIEPRPMRPMRSRLPGALALPPIVSPAIVPSPIVRLLEAGLDIAALLFLPMLVLAPRGIAALVSVAGAIAAGLLVLRPRVAHPPEMRRLVAPAAILIALLAWGAFSALWSIAPLRSLVLAARLAGLFAAGLTLAAAAGRLAAPRRLALFFIAGMVLGLALAGIESATGGALAAPFLKRGFSESRLNQASVGMAVLVYPAGALLLARRQAIMALLLAAAVAVMVCLLVGTAAKIALAAGLPVTVLLYRWRGQAARAAALASVLAILVAPAVFPRLERFPELLQTADAFKDSASHRLLIWSFAGDRIAERPLGGWGLDAARAIPAGREEIRPHQTWMPLHPHNAALQLWLELGVPGAGLAALLTAWLWLRLAKARWPRPFAAAAGASLASVLIVSLGTYGMWQEWWLGTLAFALFAVLVMAPAARGVPAVEGVQPLAPIRVAE